MLELDEYLKRILTARVYDVAVETPLQPARELSSRLGNQVLLKREDQQAVFSFKLRRKHRNLLQQRHTFSTLKPPHRCSALFKKDNTRK
jgi:threonine dehydratase